MDVLVIDDDQDVLRFVAALVETYGVGVYRASSLREAERVMEEADIDLVVCDYFIGNDIGLPWLVERGQRDGHLQGLLFTGDPALAQELAELEGQRLAGLLKTNLKGLESFIYRAKARWEREREEKGPRTRRGLEA